MRGLIAAMLLLVTTPAMARTLCDDLAAAIRRGDGSSFDEIASKSNGRLSETKGSFAVPSEYKVPDFGNAKIYPMGSDLVATPRGQCIASSGRSSKN